MILFQRLMGMETEYAIRYQPANSAAERPTDIALFKQLLTKLREYIPVAAATGTGKPGQFLANGGVVQFEQLWETDTTGLIEGATPECRSPRDALIAQQAQDRLLSKAAKGAANGEFVLLKNNRDSDGNSYGSHENCEVTFATGLPLWLWRFGLLLLAPVAVVQWPFLILIVIVLLLAFYLCAFGMWLIAVLWCALWKMKKPRLAVFLGDGVLSDDPDAILWPHWFNALMIYLVVGLSMPIVLALALLLWLTAFRPYRRLLLPLLVTRTVFTGSGWLDAAGEIHIGQKAGRINCAFAAYGLGIRPIYNYGQFLKTVLLLPVSWRPFRRLFEGKQRLQICLGDSNRCEEAEYLRLATTALVLDAIDSGALRHVPRMWFPVWTLRRISRDHTLLQVVAKHRGRKMTAIDVQRYYLEACRQFVARQEKTHPEAVEVLVRWEALLDDLEQDRDSLIGRVDWITKQHLLNSAGAGLPYAARKKIDLRYHEISEQGYYERLQRAGLIHRLTTEEEIERAQRNAPGFTPAAVRGRYIREFADGDIPLKVDWQRVHLGKGKERRTVELR